MERSSANDRLLCAGYEGVTILENFGYDSALIGVTTNNEAVYSFEAMVEWLMDEEGLSQDDAIEWIEYNTIRALPYMGPGRPIIFYKLDTE